MTDALDLSDLLAPRKSERPCPVAAALTEIPEQAADQLRPVLDQMRRDYRPRGMSLVPQANLVAAFDRCGRHVPEQDVRDHLRSRCSCA